VMSDQQLLERITLDPKVMVGKPIMALHRFVGVALAMAALHEYL
jgi:hypothetical protein